MVKVRGRSTNSKTVKQTMKKLLATVCGVSGATSPSCKVAQATNFSWSATFSSWATYDRKPNPSGRVQDNSAAENSWRLAPVTPYQQHHLHTKSYVHYFFGRLFDPWWCSCSVFFFCGLSSSNSTRKRLEDLRFSSWSAVFLWECCHCTPPQSQRLLDYSTKSLSQVCWKKKTVWFFVSLQSILLFNYFLSPADWANHCETQGKPSAAARRPPNQSRSRTASQNHVLIPSIPFSWTLLIHTLRLHVWWLYSNCIDSSWILSSASVDTFFFNATAAAIPSGLQRRVLVILSNVLEILSAFCNPHLYKRIATNQCRIPRHRLTWFTTLSCVVRCTRAGVVVRDLGTSPTIFAWIFGAECGSWETKRDKVSIEQIHRREAPLRSMFYNFLTIRSMHLLSSNYNCFDPPPPPHTHTHTHKRFYGCVVFECIENGAFVQTIGCAPVFLGW